MRDATERRAEMKKMENTKIMDTGRVTIVIMRQTIEGKSADCYKKLARKSGSDDGKLNSVKEFV